jgi:hypothetical protein
MRVIDKMTHEIAEENLLFEIARNKLKQIREL